MDSVGKKLNHENTELSFLRALGGQMGNDILGAKVLSGDFAAQAAIHNALQSGRSAQGSAASIDADIRLMDVCCEILAAADSAGLGGKDVAALIDHIGKKS